MIRPLLSTLAFRAGRVPRYVVIGERNPQPLVRVTLEGLAESLDLTRNHVMVGLRPFLIAAALPTVPVDALAAARLRLRFVPRAEPDVLLGSVDLRYAGVAPADGAALQLFQPIGRTLDCMPRGAQAVFTANHAWEDWKRRKQRSFHMRRRDLGAFQVMYMCPRPVVLVTVQHGTQNNMFPMDLIGPTGPYFLLGLRNTSPSIPLMRESRRVAIADVPYQYTAAAFQLGQHHAKASIDWAVLPFPTEPSPVHGLPVMRDALGVRDLDIRDVQDVGSHTLFVTEVVREARRHDGLQMTFVAGSYYRYLTLRGVRLPRA